MFSDRLAPALDLAKRTLIQAAIPALVVINLKGLDNLTLAVLQAAGIAAGLGTITFVYRLIRPLAPKTWWGRLATTFLTATLGVLVDTGTGWADLSALQGAALIGATATLAAAQRYLETRSPDAQE